MSVIATGVPRSLCQFCVNLLIGFGVSSMIYFWPLKLPKARKSCGSLPSCWKIGSVDQEWSNLNASGLYSPQCHPLVLWVDCGLFPFSGYPPLFSLRALRKRKILHVAYKKWKFIWQEYVCGLQMVQFECPRAMHPLLRFPFGVHYGGAFSLLAGKGKCCTWLVKKVKNIWWK